MDNSAMYIAAYFGILLANAIIVPINKNISVESIAYIIKDTSPRLIITNGLFMRRLQGKVDFEESRMIDIDKMWEAKAVPKPDLTLKYHKNAQRRYVDSQEPYGKYGIYSSISRINRKGFFIGYHQF
jgi:long-subunit acyl-CoA synthetase (AMP-forming)